MILSIYQRVFAVGIFYDTNNLPLDEICEIIKHDIEDFISWNSVNQNYIDI